MTLPDGSVLVLVIPTGIITLFSLSIVIGNQVFATSSNDEDDTNDDDDNSDSGNSNGESSPLPGSNTKSSNENNTGDGAAGLGSLFGGGNNDTEVDPAESDSYGVIIKVNESISTYENTEHGFAFEFPGHWNAPLTSLLPLSLPLHPV
jgi:hypothetical protein